MSVVELRNINKKFEIKKNRFKYAVHLFKKEFKVVLKDINLKIDSPGLYSLVGHNGSGKTTLLRIISGLLYPDIGEVLIEGRPFSINPEKVFLISEPEKGFFPRLTLKENLTFFARLNIKEGNKIKESVNRVIDQFDLRGEEESRFQELSSGIRQRLAIARAMLFDPAILLFDEITKGIDIKQQNIIYRFLKELRKKGKTIIFATHIKNEIEDLSEKVILLHKGEIIDFGEYRDIQNSIKGLFEIQ